MKILITGGAGFIGSHMTTYYIEKGWDVVVYDNLSTGNRRNLEHLDETTYTLVIGDILDREKLSQVMKGCDYVSHHAAQLEIFLAIEDPFEDLNVNTIGTINVLDAARKNNIKKMINVSSACVYGQTDHASREDEAAVPNWAYGASKLAAEKYAKIYNDYKDLPVVSLRYGIVYGEREWYRRVLPIFFKRVIENKAPVIFGRGEQVRDFIYVGDVVAIHDLCVEHDAANGYSFNVGTNIPTTIKTLAEASIAIANIDCEVIYEETSEGEFSKQIEGKKRNTAELKNMLLNINLAKKVLGWKPKMSLSEGLEREYHWAKKNIDRWNKIVSTRW